VRHWAMIQCSMTQCSSHSRSTTSMGPSRRTQDLCIRRQVRPTDRYRSSQWERLVGPMRRQRATEHRPMLTILRARLSRLTWRRRWLRAQRSRFCQRWRRLEQYQHRWLLEWSARKEGRLQPPARQERLTFLTSTIRAGRRNAAVQCIEGA
jgi:hypothetical protein